MSDCKLAVLRENENLLRGTNRVIKSIKPIRDVWRCSGVGDNSQVEISNSVEIVHLLGLQKKTLRTNGRCGASAQMYKICQFGDENG